MELNYYSDFAVRLVNTEQPERGEDTLTSVESVRELCGPSKQTARRATEADVGRLRAVRTRLRAVFSAASEGDETRAVDLLNSLLMEFPASPQISGHGDLAPDGRTRWHMHLAEHPATAAAGYTATACMGLAFHLTDLGVDRLGICQATACSKAYLDTSTNRSRRYCSDRCATRANVAAYRARKRLEGGPGRAAGGSATSGRTAENSHSSTGRRER
ncbi:CGNR zinc finger domain-containing protein [Streptomyces winkii]|uniref:CGNR zinc finger domain-containing protein n=1 Tax=Streptomyces winkii TaxID=3051178 RepID=UPI0028D90978|nr:CGNR zinc finger domain-containing protein [Streptomyces sp. DSM 40971]